MPIESVNGSSPVANSGAPGVGSEDEAAFSQSVDSAKGAEESASSKESGLELLQQILKLLMQIIEKAKGGEKGAGAEGAGAEGAEKAGGGEKPEEAGKSEGGNNSAKGVGDLLKAIVALMEQGQGNKAAMSA